MNTQLKKSRTPLASMLLGMAGAVAIGMFTPGLASAGSIVGSDHDFSGDGWSGGEICVACHTPHNADTSVAEAPLWNHAVTTSTFTPYSSGTMDSAPGQPDGVSKLCLSCHDGTVALDSFGGTTGSSFIGGDKNLGTDLSDDHPISMTYDTALSGTDPGLNDPSAQPVTIGDPSDVTRTGTVDGLMLSAGKVQCSSCHDVHNTFAVNGTKLLKVTDAGSAICLACHNK